MKHLIFFDAECPFCQFWVRYLLKIDRKALFSFASLKGKKALELGTHWKKDSFVLWENYKKTKSKILVEGKAVLRIFWLLGGGWAFLGVLSFLPSFFFDALYRFVARHRFRFFTQSEKIVFPQGRFLE